ncbi:MAG: 7-cyano-7-deazaguanine synthase QueC [Phycisphaerales bacterium]|nr:7-cyano-7-deazaguanine synthase QueC [Phycisphaerales bacterium]
MDSAVTLAEARAMGFACAALSFDYGQRHRYELEAAKRVGAAGGVCRHVVQHIDLRAFGGSALTADLDVPKDRDEVTMAASIPVTYVPARNTIFLSFALAFAETMGATDLFLGVNAVDYSGYPDCRPAFLEAFRRLANLATRVGVEAIERGEPEPIRVHAPLLDLTKSQIVRRGLELGVDFGLTHTCYDPGPDGRPCQHCDACLLRAAGFREAGVPDPALVRYGLEG